MLWKKFEQSRNVHFLILKFCWFLVQRLVKFETFGYKHKVWVGFETNSKFPRYPIFFKFDNRNSIRSYRNYTLLYCLRKYMKKARNENFINSNLVSPGSQNNINISTTTSFLPDPSSPKTPKNSYSFYFVDQNQFPANVPVEFPLCMSQSTAFNFKKVQ